MPDSFAAIFRQLQNTSSGIRRDNPLKESAGCSVRCVKDN